MNVRTFGSNLPGMACNEVHVAKGLVTLAVAGRPQACRCPRCGHWSRRVHSRYLRKLADLPWQGRRAVLLWRSRRWFCDNLACPQRIFTERQPDVAASYARRTVRLHAALSAIGLACGGELGARLAARLAMPVSSASLLRLIRRLPLPDAPAPHVVGVDDWAFRRGVRYGTILCDLQRHRAIDLLPERSADSFADWLKRRPNVAAVSRDRGGYYIQGASLGAPQAVQIADRWHLLKNLREALMRLLDHHAADLLAAAQAARPRPKNSPAVAAFPKSSEKKTSRAQSLKAEHRQKRKSRYDAVWNLHRQGVSMREIARRLGMHRSTVRLYLNTPSFPERPARRSIRRGSSIAPFLDQLRTRWQTGCRNASRLTDELREAGYQGSYFTVRRAVAAWRSSDRKADSKSLAVQRPSANQTAWALLLPKLKVVEHQSSFVRELFSSSPAIRSAVKLARQFWAIVKRRRFAAFGAWLVRAEAPDSPNELRRFARGLRRDLPAVQAALEQPWSNGQTEGQVNRLKTLKRQMYGRANFDLLRQRFLLAA